MTAIAEINGLLPVAVAHDYADLRDAFRQHLDAIGVSRMAVDHAANYPENYCSKLLALKPMRGFGPKSLSKFLRATGLVLIVAVDPRRFEKARAELPARIEHKVRRGADHWRNRHRQQTSETSP